MDPQTFWENKILQWETSRYHSASSDGLLEKAASHLSSSLRFRMAIAGELLAKFVKGRRVVEVGCGSGLLARDLLVAGASSYTGYDFASAAIDMARIRARDDGVESKARFEAVRVADLPPLDADVVFSLGLFDWLEEGEIRHLLKASGSSDWFHAIAENRGTLSQRFHQLYVHIAYGRQTGAYVPRYHGVGSIAVLAQSVLPKPIFVLRDKRLRFATFMSSLAITKAPEIFPTT